MQQIKMNLPGHEYNLFIERGLIKASSVIICELFKCKKIVIVSDKNVFGIYGKTVVEDLMVHGYEVHTVILDPGEESKSIENLQYIYDKLLGYSANRDTVLTALGGGVVGDITGFVASTFLRGVRYIQIPTSVVSQVDSSIGGKVAVNLKRGKNLIGSFYHPSAVIIDPEVLNTLDERYFYDGMAEVIKYGIIRDEELFSNLEGYKNKNDILANIEYIISRCCDIKKEIVEKDEKDTGERMLLNFGHTIGHGLEAYYDYKRYTHGEAVAVGMCEISRIGEQLGLIKKGTKDRVKEILEQFHLPFRIEGADVEKLINIMKNDKKSFDSGLNFILIRKIGDAYIDKLDLNDVKRLLIAKEDRNGINKN
ncbi:MAG: 3-dehydroquinate synthase [Bacillota bacterium]|nr:3-dehydroquinate synthase [Bacillota bacterium]